MDSSDKLSRAIDGTMYLPGIVGLNNIKANDYCNVILQVRFCSIILLILIHKHRSRDSAVGIVTGYGLDGRGVRVQVPTGAKFFLFSTSSKSVLGPTWPPIQWVLRALSRGCGRSFVVFCATCFGEHTTDDLL
jgi:hypothetical protein